MEIFIFYSGEFPFSRKSYVTSSSDITASKPSSEACICHLGGRKFSVQPGQITYVCETDST